MAINRVHTNTAFRRTDGAAEEAVETIGKDFAGAL